MTVTPRKLSLQGKEGKLKKMEAKNIVQDVKLMVRGKKKLVCHAYSYQNDQILK